MVKTTEIINFGQTKTSLENVGYRIYNPDGTPYNERQVESALKVMLDEYKKRIDEKEKSLAELNKKTVELCKKKESYLNELEKLEEKKKRKLEDLEHKKIKPQYISTAKPAYRFELEKIHEDIKNNNWEDETILIDAKVDGLRISAIKIDGDGYIYVDPAELKEKSSDVSERLPLIIDEIEKSFPDNTIVDAELYTVKNGETLHRTTTNSLLNSKEKPELLQEFAYIFVFDVIHFKSKDVRSLPLKERRELLQQIESTDHILIEEVSTNVNTEAQGYVIGRGGNKNKVDKAIKKILNDEIGMPDYFSEGIMIKLLDHQYEDQNKGWAKAKKFYEVDAIAYDRSLVLGQEKVWNYDLGIEVTEEHAKHLPEKIIIKKGDKFLFKYGRSNNSKQDVKPTADTILRIASEEVLKNENKDYTEFPWYTGYINVVLEEVPDKSKSDSLDVLERLSFFQPKRLKIDELVRLEEDSVEEKKLTDEEYDEIKKEGDPLPKKWYVNYREGEGWAQFHFRGISPEDRKLYEQGEKELWELLVGHSVHIDIRANLGLERLIQWVITESDISSYIRVLKGETDPNTGNIQKSKALVKSSGEESERRKAKDGIIDEEGAKMIADMIIKGKSFFISAGDVGATSEKDAYLGLIWEGKVKSGTQRSDLHEFFYSGTNKDILDGRFLYRCFREKEPTWWFWKAKDDEYPMNSYEHKDQGFYWPIPAKKVKKFGRESYTVRSK